MPGHCSPLTFTYIGKPVRIGRESCFRFLGQVSHAAIIYRNMNMLLAPSGSSCEIIDNMVKLALSFAGSHESYDRKSSEDNTKEYAAGMAPSRNGFFSGARNYRVGYRHDLIVNRMNRHNVLRTVFNGF